MRYIIQHLPVLSLDDPDFIGQFVFNEFFNAHVFNVVLESLLDHDYILD